MTCKTFEIRDRMTFMPVLAIRLNPADEKDRYLLGSAGYHSQPYSHVILVKLDGVEANYDPFHWGQVRRTLFHAHQYILDTFDSLENGQVIDVEFLLGETQEPKRSQQLTHPL